MAPNNPFAKDLIPQSDPKLHLKWAKPRIVRDAYTPLPDDLLPVTDCSEDPGLTDQSQAADADVNHILKRALAAGVLPGQDIPRIYADVSNAPDYQAAQELIANAHSQFNALNAQARKKFNNNPAEFLAFVEDPKNAKELVDLGLAVLTPSHPVPDPKAGQPEANKPVLEVNSQPAPSGNSKPT